MTKQQESVLEFVKVMTIKEGIAKLREVFPYPEYTCTISSRSTSYAHREEESLSSTYSACVQDCTQSVVCSAYGKTTVEIAVNTVLNKASTENQDQDEAQGGE